MLFGLATDYEVFLLARIREEYDATGDNTTAVATGLQRTGQIISSAALLLIVVLAGLATGQGRLRQDHRDWHAHRHHSGRGPRADTPGSRDYATARPLELVAPGPLAALHRRYGISETTGDSPAEPRPTTPALTK